jgi:hypothetical protein
MYLVQCLILAVALLLGAPVGVIFAILAVFAGILDRDPPGAS